MMAVRMTFEPELQFSTPMTLFERAYAQQHPPSYDVAPDGRFLMIKPLTEEGREIILVQNWFSELERLVPTN